MHFVLKMKLYKRRRKEKNKIAHTQHSTHKYTDEPVKRHKCALFIETSNRMCSSSIRRFTGLREIIAAALSLPSPSTSLSSHLYVLCSQFIIQNGKRSLGHILNFNKLNEQIIQQFYAMIENFIAFWFHVCLCFERGQLLPIATEIASIKIKCSLIINESMNEDISPDELFSRPIIWQVSLTVCLIFVCFLWFTI